MVAAKKCLHLVTEQQQGEIPPHVTACLTIDLGAIRENYRLLQAMVKPGTQVAGIVKADAYGLGMKEIASVLYQEGCRTFFVADPLEGQALRTCLPDARIFVFHGVLEGCESLFDASRLIPVLNDLDQVERWSSWARRHGEPRAASLHFDTGMTRNGLSARETALLFADRDRLKGLELCMILSHLASSDEMDSPQNKQQWEAFQSIVRHFPGVPASLANSCGLPLGEDYHYDWVRPGLGLYGYATTPQRAALKPALSLQVRIIQIHAVESGQTVGYNATYRAPQKGRLATLGIGYADGVLRSLSNKGAVRWGPFLFPVVGRISMDYMVVDISEAPASLCSVGQWVTLFESCEDLLKWAHEAGTISYEILTLLGRRCYRQYKGSRK